MNKESSSKEAPSRDEDICPSDKQKDNKVKGKNQSLSKSSQSTKSSSGTKQVIKGKKSNDIPQRSQSPIIDCDDQQSSLHDSDLNDDTDDINDDGNDNDDNGVEIKDKSTAEYKSISPLCVEVAKTSRAKCKDCEECIEKGEVKLGQRVFCGRNGYVHVGQAWFHPQCAFTLYSTKSEASNFKRFRKTPTCKVCDKVLVIHENTDASKSEIQTNDDDNDDHDNDDHDDDVIFRIGGKSKCWYCFRCIHSLVLESSYQLDVSACDIKGYEDLQVEQINKIKTIFPTMSLPTSPMSDR